MLLRRLLIAIIAVGLVTCGFALGTAVMWSGAQNDSAPQNTTVEDVPLSVDLQTTGNTGTQLTDTEQLFTNLYSHVSPSVVAIYVTFTDANNQVGTAFGSGFVLDTAGHIITNNHVVENAEAIEVNFVDGTRVRGEVAGADPDSDLAVVQVDVPSDHLFPVTLGNSDSLLIGQMTVAIGSPFGQRWTMTTGIVSALDRRIQGLTDYSVGGVIQTDAAINPGNSGGPLFDLQGEVIGVNSQIITDSFGIGFAIPSNLVNRVARALIADGTVNYSYLGIRGGEITDLTLDAMAQFNLPNNLRGVFVDYVDPGGPAEQAGIHASNNSVLEIITAIDGAPIGGFSELVAYLAMNTQPGDVVNLTLLRDGAEVTIPVTLGARPAR